MSARFPFQNPQRYQIIDMLTIMVTGHLQSLVKKSPLELEPHSSSTLSQCATNPLYVQVIRLRLLVTMFGISYLWFTPSDDILVSIGKVFLLPTLVYLLHSPHNIRPRTSMSEKSRLPYICRYEEIRPNL